MSTTASSTVDAVTVPKSNRRLLRVIWYLLIAAAVIVLLIAGAYGLWYASATSKLNTSLKSARERGEPVWYSDLKPGPVDANEDGGPLFVAAMAKFVEPGEDFYAVYEAAKADAGSTEFERGDMRNIAAGPGGHPEFRKARVENSAALELLREAISKPYCRIPRNYDTHEPVATPLPEVQSARGLARVLEADSLQALGTGQSARAVEAIEEMFGLAECLREEPHFGSQLVRIAVGTLAVRSLERVLVHGELTDAQFTKLDARLKAVEASFRLKHAMLGERASAMTTLQYFSGAVRPLMAEQQAFVLDVMREVAENADQEGPKGRQVAFQVDNAFIDAPARFKHARLLLLPTVSVGRTSGLMYRQLLIDARLAMRVHHYRRQNGQLPAKLEDVLDGGMAKLPEGIFSFKPPVYRIEGDGFVIYAVGTNATDDGGGQFPDYEEGNTAFRVRYAPVSSGADGLAP